MENTEFRLNESKFFLDKMKESKGKTLEFEYFLNAYISSARSVLWIMKSEYSSVSGWKNWYDDKNPNADQKDLLDGVVTIRNRSLKQKPLKVRKYTTIGDNDEFYDIYDVFKKYIGKEVTVKIETLDTIEGVGFYDDEHQTSVTGKLKIATTVEEFKNKDILDICIEYDTWLSEIVNECIHIFG